jgi:hypothetical protein
MMEGPDLQRRSNRNKRKHPRIPYHRAVRIHPGPGSDQCHGIGRRHPHACPGMAYTSRPPGSRRSSFQQSPEVF